MEHTTITAAERSEELARLEAALSRARIEIEKVRHVAEQKVGDSASDIFEAQLMMVTDDYILGPIRDQIQREPSNNSGKFV